MIVVAVEYLNTLPMIYGIRCVAPKELCDGLRLAPPAECARLAKDGKCDIALVPVGALCDIPNAQIITDYSISATGKVDTVALLSNTPVENITTIFRDSHSRTSVKLCKVLCDEKWKIAPEFIDGLPAETTDGQGVVAIGDKVFEIQDKFKYKYDLSEEWMELTGLPFVFAVWVALTPEGVAAEKELNDALSYGVSHISESLPDDPLRPRNYKYLTEHIEYPLCADKHKAMQLFLSKVK